MQPEHFIDINENNNTAHVRINLIFNKLKQILAGNFPFIDYLYVIKSLTNSGRIYGDLFNRLTEISSSEEFSQREKLLKFIQLLVDRCSAERVYFALSNAECCFLFPIFLLLKYGTRVSCVGKVNVQYSECSNEKYRFIKTCVDNNCFKIDKRQKLANFRRRAGEKVSEGRTLDECQKYLEEKVLIDLSCVQLYGVSDSKIRFEILHEMNETRTPNLDRTSLELTSHSKMAVTYAKIGQQTQAEEHIRQTLVMSDRCLPCFATIMALNDVMYAYQELCFVIPSQDLLRKAKDHGQLMYHVMTCEDENVVNQWKRIILLFLAMTYLKISHEFEVSEMRDVSADDIQQARALITEVKKVSTGIEKRREMVLYLCQGRINECDDRRFAIDCVEKAHKLVNDGCLRETERSNIQSYLTFLRTDT